jgi:hypothetical protein
MGVGGSRVEKESCPFKTASERRDLWGMTKGLERVKGADGTMLCAPRMSLASARLLNGLELWTKLGEVASPEQGSAVSRTGQRTMSVGRSAWDDEKNPHSH